MQKGNPTYQTICVELGKANLVSPNRANIDDLREMAEIFYEVLREWSPRTIEAAFRDHIKNNKWMPSPADIEDRCRAASQSIEYERQREKALPMPEDLSEKQRQENLRRLRDIMSPAVQTIFIAEKYKPDNPISESSLKIVYIPEPLKENKQRYKQGKDFI